MIPFLADTDVHVLKIASRKVVLTQARLIKTSKRDLDIPSVNSLTFTWQAVLH